MRGEGGVMHLFYMGDDIEGLVAHLSQRSKVSDSRVGEEAARQALHERLLRFKASPKLPDSNFEVQIINFKGYNQRRPEQSG
jgi:hypothetical protein